MFTGVGHHNWFNGSIGIIDPRQGSNFPHGLTRVTWDLPWGEVGNSPADRCESPQVSCVGSLQGTWAPIRFPKRISGFRERQGCDKFRVYLMDVHGNRELIYEGGTTPGTRFPSGRARFRLGSRISSTGPEPERTANRKSRVCSTTPTFTRGVPELPRGSVKYLRVFQQDAKTYSTWKKTFAFSGPPVSAVQSEAVKRIVSVVPVEADGSVYFEAPAGESFFFQLLDEQYRALHTMRSFSGVLPGERRGCVGCHKMHSTAPPVKSGLALRRTPTAISPPPWGTESIGYQRFVQPVLDRYCGECHQGDGKARKDCDLTVRPAPGVFQGAFQRALPDTHRAGGMADSGAQRGPSGLRHRGSISGVRPATERGLSE